MVAVAAARAGSAAAIRPNIGSRYRPSTHWPVALTAAHAMVLALQVPECE